MTAARDHVARTIQAHPGLHLRELSRRSGLAVGALRHHLDALEKDGFVRRHADRRFVRWFAVPLAESDRIHIAALRQAPHRRVVLVLLDGRRSHGDIAAALGVGTGAASLYLRNLVNAGVIDVDDRLYGLVDPETARRVLREHRASFLDRLVDHALELFEGR